MGYAQEVPVQKTGMGGGTKVLLGCGAIGCLIVVLICSGIAVFSWWGFSTITRMAEEFQDELEGRGYEVVTGHIIQVTQKLEKPTAYVCQVLEINEKVDVNIAILSQVAEINADVDGDIEFLGQAMTVKQGVVVNGNIHARGAQVIDIKGTVKGKVTGTYQILNGKVQNEVIERGKPKDSSSHGEHDHGEFEIPLDDKSSAPQTDAAEKPGESGK